MGNSTFQHGNLHEVLLGGIGTLLNGSGYLTGLSKTPTDHTLTVTYDHDGCKRESTSTLRNLGHTVDGNQTVFKLYVTINSYSIHCHNRLEFKTSLTSRVGQSLHTTMIKITVTIEDDFLDTSLFCLVGN